MKHRGILIVVSGFSGAGKGTLMKALMRKYKNYALSVSMTTRMPRNGEQEGREYFFSDRESFEQKIQEDGFIEYACYCNHYYGTPKAYVEKQLELGKDVILEIEIQGALKIRQKFPNALLLFMMPPSAEELKRRLVGRGTETMEIINQRMSRAREEAEGVEAYDYIVINDQLDECVEELHSIVKAAHNTPGRNQGFIEEMRKELGDIAKGEQ